MTDSQREMVDEIESIASALCGRTMGHPPRVVITSAAAGDGERIFRAAVRLSPTLPVLARFGSTEQDAERALLASLRCLAR